MKLCIMNQREGNASTCDDDVPSTKLHFNSDSDDSNYSPTSDSDCDLDIEMTNRTPESPSPPDSPASLVSSSSSSPASPSSPACPGESNLMMSNRPASPVIADYTACSHCANSALTSASSSSSSGTPLSDLSNKRLCTAKEIVSLIRKGKFDEFLNLLQSKPNLDVNTFVNGNTALHYCLLFGKWLDEVLSFFSPLFVPPPIKVR